MFAMRWAALAIGVVALACSSGGSSSNDGGGNDGAAAGPSTCQQIRMCAFDCADDACVPKCRAPGSTAAQAAWDALLACTKGACPTAGDITCACSEQCLADGACLAEVDGCLGAMNTDDAICDSLCH
jgi:hypothetical protein